MAADTTHRASPREDGEGLVRAMRRALHIGGLDPEEIDYVNAHGTGTVLNDRIEALAMRRLLGDRVGRVACSSTKPVTGHCLGASSALEAVITILSLRDQIAPPTANCLELDPECRLDVVTGTARPMAMQGRDVEFAGILGQERLTHLRTTDVELRDSGCIGCILGAHCRCGGGRRVAPPPESAH